MGRRGEEEERSFVVRKIPARPSAGRAGRPRAQPGDEGADGVWENDTHTLDAAAAATPSPGNLRGRDCPGLLRPTSNANAGVTREPWLPRSAAASRWHAS